MVCAEGFLRYWLSPKIISAERTCGDFIMRTAMLRESRTAAAMVLVGLMLPLGLTVVLADAEFSISGSGAGWIWADIVLDAPVELTLQVENSDYPALASAVLYDPAGSVVGSWHVGTPGSPTAIYADVSASGVGRHGVGDPTPAPLDTSGTVRVPFSRSGEYRLLGYGVVNNGSWAVRVSGGLVELMRTKSGADTFFAPLREFVRETGGALGTPVGTVHAVLNASAEVLIHGRTVGVYVETPRPPRTPESMDLSMSFPSGRTVSCPCHFFGGEPDNVAGRYVFTAEGATFSGPFGGDVYVAGADVAWS